MLQIILLSFFTFTLLFADTADKKISLDMRSIYVNYDYDNYWRDSEAFVSSLKLGYKDEIIADLEVGATFGAIADFGLSDESKQSMTYIFNRQNETFTLLHEAYLKYKFANNFIQLGRFEFTSPLIDSDDYFLLANSFEGMLLSLNLKNVNIQAGHITKMSGAWDAGYDGGEFVSMSKSPWMHKADNQETSQWVNPVTDFGVDANGISFLGLTYANDAYKFQLWDYYAKEFFNSIYTQIDLKLNTFDLAFQYNTFDAVGQLKNNPHPSSKIDYAVWGAKISTDIQNTKITLAYTGVSDDESAHLWGSFGGYPYFASGMMVTYFETSLRDAHIYALNADTSFIKNLNTSFHLGYYDLNKGYTIDTTGNRNAISGEDYMYTYGISNSYALNKQTSFTLKLAGRTLETGNSSKLLRAIVKFTF